MKKDTESRANTFCLYAGGVLLLLVCAEVWRYDMLTLALLPAVLYAFIVWSAIDRRLDGAHRIRYKCSGLFFHLVRSRLCILQGLPKGERLEKFAALYAAVLRRYPHLEQEDKSMYPALIFVAATTASMILAREDFPLAYVYAWLGVVVLYKIIWDARRAWVLHRLLLAEDIIARRTPPA